MDKLSVTLENYLEAIFELSGREGGAGARLTDIAERLSVTKATANAAMASLAEKGMVKNERWR
jgi:Mn-dependent DtxR family transcriptional regulator